eukprot:TRINITY_DN8370_c0_g1_i1.p1 TRINITY_DN8370_c0_g1~~TRINITY_DN8370_c0_g1_i1.p1  ORF type:complete len:775 (+),score=141.29 TRINITY_DN8370_c0_g1_i1:43-2367(+)
MKGVAKKISLFIFLLYFFSLALSEPFTPRILHSLKRLSSPTASTKQIVYQRSQWIEATDTQRSNLRSYRFDQGNSRDLTNPLQASDTNPAFSPEEDFVVFLSNRNGKNNIYYTTASGSEANVQLLFETSIDITSFKWSPSGDYIIFSAEAYVNCTTLQCTETKNNEAELRGPRAGYLYDSLYVRHWDRWITPGKASHLFKADITTNSTHLFVTEIVDIMSSMYADSPVPPFGGAEMYDISPIGDEIAFTVEMKEPDMAWKTGWRVYTYSVATNSFDYISNFTTARCQNPAYSPDGFYLAFLCMDRPGYESDKLHIVLHDRSNSENRRLLPNLDRSMTSIDWLDKDHVIVSFEEIGRLKLYKVNIFTDAINRLVDTGSSPEFAVLPQNSSKVAVVHNSAMHPNEIYLLDSINQTLEELTQENKEVLQRITFSPTEEFTFTSAYDGIQVKGWLWTPYNFNIFNKHPVALLIHGGPQASWDDAWSYRWNYQLWASRGYVVVAINPRGSLGFGQNFTDSVNGHWGTAPYLDLMSGLDWVLANKNYTDKDNVCSCGGSFGGYMGAWINGQTSRFKCLVIHAPLFDTRYSYYMTDEQFFMEWEFGEGKYPEWEAPENYNRWNPLNNISNWNTPTLVTQGGRDYRAPETEGLGVFVALQRKQIPSKFLYFPLQNHWILDPVSSIIWYETVFEWLDQWTGNKPPYTPSPPPTPSPTYRPTNSPTFIPPPSNNPSPQPTESPKSNQYPLISWLIPTLFCFLLLILVIVLSVCVWRERRYEKLM